jgi:hypothetical protein
MLTPISTENNNLTKVEHPTTEVKESKFINTSLNDAVNNTPIENRTITTDEINSSHKDVNSTAFNSVTARVKPKEMEVINEKLKLITADDISQLLDICSDPNLIQNNKKDFFLHEDFPYVALKALQQQDISASEFSTLATLHAVVLELMQENGNSEFPVVFHNLFNKDGSNNDNSWNKIKYSLINADPDGSFIHTQISNITYSMKHTMSNKRPIEAGFWIYKSDIKIRNNSNNISHRINELGASIFFYLEQDFTMLPSISMRQEFLNALFKSDACHINPVIGTTKVKDLHDGALIRSRDFAIPFPNLPLPKTADEMEAPRIVDFQNHDGYHALKISQLDSYDIKNYLGFANALKALAIALSAKRDAIKELALEKISLFEKFKDNLESLSDTNKEKAMIKLQRELYKIKKLIDFLNKNIKAINRFKFSLYDLEMPYSYTDEISSIEFLDITFRPLINISRFLTEKYVVGENIDVTNFYAMITGNKLTAYHKDFYSENIDVSKSKEFLIKNAEDYKKYLQKLWLTITDIERKQDIERECKKLDLTIQFLQPEKKH